MADEIGGMWLDSGEIGGQVREDTNKVTEEAVQRVQDNQKKAQQVQQEIKKDKATNDKLAKFLTFLLKDIKNDTVVKQIYHTFFKTKDEETDLVHLRKNINTTIIVGMFAPFYAAQMKELGLVDIYQDLRDFDQDVYLTGYISYIKQLLPKYHDGVVIDRQDFISLLTSVSEYYELIEKLSTDKVGEFKDTLKKEIWFTQ